MNILVSGFEPFGGDTINASWEAVRALPDQINGACVTTVCLPVEYVRSWQLLRQAIEKLRPDAVVSVGQAGGRGAITPEKIAVNLMSGRIADNAGVLHCGEKISEDGDDGYFATLQTEAIVDAIRSEKIPAEMSYTAGTYVCNCLMYNLLHYLKREMPAARGGFIHLPCLPEQVLDSPRTPSMSRETAVSGLTAAIRAIAEGR